MNGYVSKSIPIYYGSDKKTLDEYLNMKSFIFCDIPMNLTKEDSIKEYEKLICGERYKNTNITDKAEKYKLCASDFEEYVLNLVKPYFDKCINQIIKVDNDDNLYKQILSENFVKLKNNELQGIFNGTLTGELVDFVYNVLNY